MMQQTLPWIIALVAVAVLAPTAVWLALRPRRPVQPKPLPTEWALTARPVFSNDERRVYRQLREALPHHIVLSKLPWYGSASPMTPNKCAIGSTCWDRSTLRLPCAAPTAGCWPPSTSSYDRG
jgi:hypothetical protein